MSVIPQFLVSVSRFKNVCRNPVCTSMERRRREVEQEFRTRSTCSYVRTNTHSRELIRVPLGDRIKNPSGIYETSLRFFIFACFSICVAAGPTPSVKFPSNRVSPPRAVLAHGSSSRDRSHNEVPQRAPFLRANFRE